MEKKKYKKPMIVIESFSLDTNIAGNCEKPFNLQAQFVCGIPDENGLGMNIFTPGLDGGNCIVPGNGDNAKYDGFCYHVPTENNELFNS